MRLTSRVRTALTALMLAPALAGTVATATTANAASNVGTTARWAQLTKAHPVGHGWTAKSAFDVPCGAINKVHHTIACLGSRSLVAGVVAPHSVTSIGRVSFRYGGNGMFTAVRVDGKAVKAPYGYWPWLNCSVNFPDCQWQPIEG